MWDRKDNKATNVKPLDVKPTEAKPEAPASVSSAPVVAEAAVNLPKSDGSIHLPKTNRDEVVKIGHSIFIKGEVSGHQDLIIEGKVEGKIELRENQLTIGENGRITGEIYARHVVIFGQVTGNTLAGEKLEIKASGILKGDIIAPRLVIEDGAHFRGSVEMEVKDAKREERKDKKDRPRAEFAELARETSPADSRAF